MTLNYELHINYEFLQTTSKLPLFAVDCINANNYHWHFECCSGLGIGLRSGKSLLSYDIQPVSQPHQPDNFVRTKGAEELCTLPCAHLRKGNIKNMKNKFNCTFHWIFSIDL